jgi:hypothetical protein
MQSKRASLHHSLLHSHLHLHSILSSSSSSPQRCIIAHLLSRRRFTSFPLVRVLSTLHVRDGVFKRNESRLVHKTQPLRGSRFNKTFARHARPLGSLQGIF